MQVSIAIAQLRPKKGDYQANVNRLAELFGQLAALEPMPEVLVLPETALNGYFLEGGVRDSARRAGTVFHDIQQVYLESLGDDAPALDIVVGFYEQHRDRYYNSVLYATLGSDETAGIRHVHRKVFLPTYGVFDEERFLEAGHQIAAFDTGYGRAAMLICEDAWHSLSGTIAALDGAQIVFIVSASPARGATSARPDNVEHWEDLAHRIADEHGVYVVLAQLVGSEAGKVFPGSSFLMGPRGNVRVTAPLWEEAIITATIDLDDLPLARADLPLLADLEGVLPHLQRELDRVSQATPARVAWDAAPKQSNRASFNRAPAQLGKALPVINQAPFDINGNFLELNCELTHAWLLEFLRDEIQRRRGFKSVVVGLSGGVDSALTTVLCAQAFGPENVLAIRMPYRTSSQDSLDHAQLVVDKFGVKCITVDISAAVDGYAQVDPDMDGRRKGNVMARMRMITLFDHAQKFGTIPMGTGNKTERLFGYYTWHADDAPPVNPLGDLFKSQVWQLSSYVGVPDVIVNKPASADLVVGQTDESDFGISYPMADRILYFLLQGYSAEKIVSLGYSASDVAIVKRRLDTTHWKRHLPSAAMISDTAIGDYYLRPLDY
jgi:NAD+ synthase (glutamine-hydrolysing)